MRNAWWSLLGLLLGCAPPAADVVERVDALATAVVIYTGSGSEQVGRQVATCANGTGLIVDDGLKQIHFVDTSGNLSPPKTMPPAGGTVVCARNEAYIGGPNAVSLATNAGPVQKWVGSGQLLAGNENVLFAVRSSAVDRLLITDGGQVPHGSLAWTPASSIDELDGFVAVGSSAAQRVGVFLANNGIRVDLPTGIQGPPGFGRAVILGDFSPVTGIEVAVAHDQGVQLYNLNTAADLGGFTFPVGGGKNILARQPAGLTDPNGAAVDLLLVGDPDNERVFRLAGTEVLDEIHRMPGSITGFGTALAFAPTTKTLFIGHANSSGAVSSTQLQQVSRPDLVIEDCRGIGCGGNYACLGGIGCVPTLDFDAGTPPTDAGTPPTDAGTPPTDAGTPPTDAGTTPTDAGTTPTDAGTTPTDAGTTPTDAGTTPTDAGTTPTDAGTTTTDGGQPPITWAASGCGCSSGTAFIPLLGLVLLQRRRR